MNRKGATNADELDAGDSPFFASSRPVSVGVAGEQAGHDRADPRQRADEATSRSACVNASVDQLGP